MVMYFLIVIQESLYPQRYDNFIKYQIMIDFFQKFYNFFLILKLNKS